MQRETLEISNTHVNVTTIDGLAEGIEIMEAALQDTHSVLGRSSLQQTNDQNPWSGTRDMEQAIQLARYGWPEGTRLLEQTLDGIDIHELIGQRQSVETYHDYGGDEVDVDRYLADYPDSMMQYDLQYDVKGKIVTLIMNCSLDWSIRPQQIMNRGAAILAAKEILTIAGYSLGITMMESVRTRNQVCEYMIPIHKPGEYVDTDTIAFCLANPAFLRRLVFALNETEDIAMRKIMGFSEHYGYGAPQDVITPLPPNSLHIMKDEGLSLHGSSEIAAFAGNLVVRAMNNQDADIL